MIDPASAFVDAVRTRLDRSMTDAGFPLNGVYGSDEDDPAEQVSVLYEGVVSDFLSRYPGLDPVWDEAWRRGSNGCVDLWLKWRGDNDTISVDLEHWEIRKLAERYGDASMVSIVDRALAGPGNLENRVEVIAAVLERALSQASVT